MEFSNTPQEDRSGTGPAKLAGGLASATYLEIRGKEECYRAQRYRRPLSLIVAALSAPDRATEERLQKWLQSQVRASDIAAHLGNGAYALLLPESDDRAAAGVISRLSMALPTLRTSTGTYTGDGTTWDEFFRKVSTAVAPPGQAGRQSA